MFTLAFPTRGRSLLCRVFCVVAAGLIGISLADASEVRTPACIVAGSALDQTLTRTSSQLMKGSLTVVAIGSSSTEGAGASSDAATYPSRLEALLSVRFPGIAIRVLNRGVGGEEEGDMLARFDRDVFAEKPDLVLWQVASNAIVRKRHLSTQERLIRTGVARLKESGADVVLVDPQYTRAVIEEPLAGPTVDLITAEARKQNVGAFRRFDLMRDWHETQRLPFEVFSIADGLHMNDWGYDCLARNLASAITNAAAQPLVASASGASVR